MFCLIFSEVQSSTSSASSWSRRLETQFVAPVLRTFATEMCHMTMKINYQGYIVRCYIYISIICIYIYTCIWFKRSPFKTVLFVTSWVALIFPGCLTHAMWPSMNEWIWSVWSAKAKVGTEVLALLHGMQLSHARICRRFKGWVCHVTRSLSQ